MTTVETSIGDLPDPNDSANNHHNSEAGIKYTTLDPNCTGVQDWDKSEATSEYTTLENQKLHIPFNNNPKCTALQEALALRDWVLAWPQSFWSHPDITPKARVVHDGVLAWTESLISDPQHKQDCNCHCPQPLIPDPDLAAEWRRYWKIPSHNVQTPSNVTGMDKECDVLMTDIKQ